MSLKELQGPLPGVMGTRGEESEGRGRLKSGEVTRIRGSRIANDFSTGGVRQRESWLTCLD